MQCVTRSRSMFEDSIYSNIGVGYWTVICLKDGFLCPGMAIQILCRPNWLHCASNTFLVLGGKRFLNFLEVVKSESRC